MLDFTIDPPWPGILRGERGGDARGEASRDALPASAPGPPPTPAVCPIPKSKESTVVTVLSRNLVRFIGKSNRVALLCE
jgi:hypothetical protein